MNLTSLLRFLPSVLLLLACNSNKEFDERYNSETGLTERIEYYPDGQIKARGNFKEGKKHGGFIFYYENSNLKERSVYQDDLLEGILRLYHPNGKLREETTYSKGEPIGWSYEYRENGVKHKAHQYIRFEDRYIGNQRIRYNEAGEILPDSSHYITVSRDRDTISLGEEIRLRFKLDAPFYGSKSQVRLLVGGFDEQYRLVNLAATDTINGDGLSAEYRLIPKEKGKQVIRGRLEDYKVQQISDKELMERFEIKREDVNDVAYRTESVYINFSEEFYVK